MSLAQFSYRKPPLDWKVSSV